MSEGKKIPADTKLSLDEEKNLGFLIAMAETNTEKITKEILEGLSEDTDDSGSEEPASSALSGEINSLYRRLHAMCDRYLPA